MWMEPRKETSVPDDTDSNRVCLDTVSTKELVEELRVRGDHEDGVSFYEVHTPEDFYVSEGPAIIIWLDGPYFAN